MLHYPGGASRAMRHQVGGTAPPGTIAQDGLCVHTEYTRTPCTLVKRTLARPVQMA